MYFRNQRMIAINRETPKKSSNKKYLCCYIENIERAMKDLSKTAFQCYIYLLCNKNGFELEYSPAHISLTTGMCIESARKAFSELNQKGYLVECKGCNKFYNFYEKPLEREEVRSITNPYTGEIIEMTYQETMKMFGYVEGITIWEGAK